MNIAIMRPGLLLLILVSWISISSFAKPANDNSSDSINQEKPEKIAARMSLRYFKKADGAQSLKVSVWYKEGKKNIPVENTLVNLYLEEVSDQGILGNVTTDENGEATYILTDRFQQYAEGKYEFIFISKLMNEEQFQSAEEEITIKKSNIVFDLSEEDSTVSVKLTHVAGPDSLVPISDSELKIGIRRSFSILPIGEPITTDENGSGSVHYSGDVPGDKEGNLRIVAKVEDHDDIGNIEYEIPVKWGVPVNPVILEKRSLWASGANAPIPLVSVSVAIVLGIWSVLFYLVLQLFKIKKISKKAE